MKKASPVVPTTYTGSSVHEFFHLHLKGPAHESADLIAMPADEIVKVSLGGLTAKIQVQGHQDEDYRRSTKGL